ncbi:hypothetical protein [Streptomyces sp. MMG1121]|uniref:hypothetical protein n=1 Tax=Streptomyces sp. MMG1121 TaxID=1415544 RepID=UPI0003C99D57|nr:hypothetical protein [Streptomyces sp. MMG1121]AGZ94169.1 hypothetical protein [Streptomyces sp. MMG1121]
MTWPTVDDETVVALVAPLMGAGPHGLEYAVAAAGAALRQQRPVVMLTWHVGDMTKLCGERVRLVAV